MGPCVDKFCRPRAGLVWPLKYLLEERKEVTMEIILSTELVYPSALNVIDLT